MSATLIGTYVPQSPEWHAARLDGIGGSEIAAVLGLSKWESRYSLHQRKKGRIPPQVENPEMEWGTRLEPAVLAKFTDNHPDLTVETTGTWRNNDRPWQIANPDALARCDDHGIEVVEVKTAYDDWEWGPEGSDQVPPYYLAQARWYLDVLDLPVCHLAVLIGGFDYREYVIRPDEADTALLREAGQAFMDDLHAGRVPDIDAHDATYQAVKQLPDGVIDDAVEIEPALADRYQAACENHKAATDEKRHATSLVLAEIGDYRYADCGGHRVATRAVTSDGRTHSLRPARTSRKEHAA